MSPETDTPGGAISAEKAAEEAAAGAAEPSLTVPHSEQTASHPAGSAMPEGGVPFTERPEALVGAAFAGGLLAAIILRKIAG